MKKMLSPKSSPFVSVIFLAAALPGIASAQNAPAAAAARGKAFFEINCAVCHSPVLGPNNTVIMKQGPSLVGVVGRTAGSSPHFNYSKAMSDSGLTWDTATLFKFLANPMVVVPGTIMPMPIPDVTNRADVITYLSTLK